MTPRQLVQAWVDAFNRRDVDALAMSDRLLAHGICATAMQGWGETPEPQYIRFVFADEPAARLEGVGQRIRAALGV